MPVFANIAPMAPPNRLVVAVAYDNLCMFEFAVAAELFGLDRPELDCLWYDFRVVSSTGGSLQSIGVQITADASLNLLEEAGTIIIPGWSDRAEAPPQELIDALLRAHERGARLVSICSGVFALAATGLLDGIAATTHWRYIDELRARYPAIDVQPDVLYIDNGSVLTSAGSAAGIDLGLHIIRLDYGADVANEVARRMVVPTHRDGGQAQFISQPVSYEADGSISHTLDWALGELQAPLTTKVMARHAQMSERTFARRFTDATGTTPHRWITQNRIRRAQDLLETTTLSVEQIAGESGLGSSANLRHHFQQVLRTTPTRYRKTFQRTTELGVRP